MIATDKQTRLYMFLDLKFTIGYTLHSIMVLNTLVQNGALWYN